MSSFKLQEWIHGMEEGKGAGLVKAVTFVAALLMLAYTYNTVHFRNFSTAEAMDTAQLARNLAEGKGYTTQFLRPVSLWLLEKKGGDMRLEQHPDLANAPIYPGLLAGLMKLWPAAMAVQDTGETRAHEPEVVIACLNQGLFLLAIWLVFRLARRLFDASVAWLTALVLAGTDLLWRFSISGLSTMLLLVLVLLLVWCLVVAEQGAREKQWGAGRLFFLALLAGALAGVCGLTRYSFLCLMLPTLLYFLLYMERQKILLGIAVLVGFAGVVSPWLVRNHQLSGTLFGTAGLVAYEDTPRFPGHRLERALRPDNTDNKIDLAKVEVKEQWEKLWLNLPLILQHDLPRLGGSWVAAFFLVGLLVPFRNPTLSRVRWFAVLSLLLLAVLQALGRTAFAAESPDVNSENLVALLVPLVAMYGAGLYVTLREQSGVRHPAWRNLANGLCVLLASAPLIFRLTGESKWPLAYPPYSPMVVRDCASLLKSDELMMSDVPWAVAWYGNRPCLWLTWDIKNEFRSVHARKHIAALYLTQVTLDGRLLTDLTLGREREWGRLALKSVLRTDPGIKDTVWGNFAWEAVMKEEVPDEFPLAVTLRRGSLMGSLFPEQLLLVDRVRWPVPAR